jgi:hypothetical protein
VQRDDIGGWRLLRVAFVLRRLHVQIWTHQYVSVRWRCVVTLVSLVDDQVEGSLSVGPSHYWRTRLVL